jgi:multisubunit Na+/H+ antiporter MnhB subunit
VNGLANTLLGFGVIVLAFDLLVLRLMLRKRPGHRLVVVGAVCLVAALLLLWLLPPRTAG